MIWYETGTAFVSDENKKFYKYLCERFWQRVQNLEMINRAKIITLQHLKRRLYTEDIY